MDNGLISCSDLRNLEVLGTILARTAEAETLLSRIASPVPFDVQVWTPEEVRGGVAEGQTYVHGMQRQKSLSRFVF